MTTFIDYLLGGFSSGAVVIALMAIALVLVWRSTRMVNFAQVGQAMFTIALTIQQQTGNWLLALVVAIAAGVVRVIVFSGYSTGQKQRLNRRHYCYFRRAHCAAGRGGHGLGRRSGGFVPPVDNSGLEIGGGWPFSL